MVTIIKEKVKEITVVEKVIKEAVVEKNKIIWK